MAKTMVGLTTGKTLTVDGSVEEVKNVIEAARAGWASLSSDDRQVAILGPTVAWLEEVGQSEETASEPATRAESLGPPPHAAGIRREKF